MAPFSASQAAANSSTSSVRRNLFTNHLSHRRPDTASSNTAPEPTRIPSANSSTHSLSNLTNAPPSRRPASRHNPSSDSLNHHSNITNNSDIITRDHLGRPSLPDIPLLPPHLRLSSTTGDGDSSHPNDVGTSETEMSMGDVQGLELESAMREREDQERIEKSLVDMMYRSRMRGNGHHGHGHAGSGGLGAESEELLALVQASLRKKAASLEEDRWMFEGEPTEEI